MSARSGDDRDFTVSLNRQLKELMSEENREKKKRERYRMDDHGTTNTGNK